MFRTVTALSVAEAATDLQSFGERLVQKGEPVVTDRARERVTAWLLGAALKAAQDRLFPEEFISPCPQSSSTIQKRMLNVRTSINQFT